MQIADDTLPALGAAGQMMRSPEEELVRILFRNPDVVQKHWEAVLCMHGVTKDITDIIATTVSVPEAFARGRATKRGWECPICYESKERGYTCLACGHCVCEDCGKKLEGKPCPTCRCENKESDSSCAD